MPGAKHRFLPQLREYLDELDRDEPIATYCGNGCRASIAASPLQAEGFREVRDVPGSFSAWKKAGLPVEGGAA